MRARALARGFCLARTFGASQHPSCCRYHFVHGHGLHTSKIQGTLAQEAWAAFHMMPQDDLPVTDGAGQARLSRAKDRNCWYSQIGREMHRAGVIRDEQTTPPEVLHQLRQIRLTCEIRRRRPEPTGQLPPKGDFLGRSKDQPAQTERFTEPFRSLA